MDPSTAWREIIPDGEDAVLAGLAEELAAVQRSHAARTGKTDRALHAKPHIPLRAHLVVDDGLPPHAQQGLFARPGRYQAYVRLSNGSGARAHDRIADIRGLAVKVLGVEGQKVLGEHPTQDFLAIDADRAAFRDPREFVTVVVAASGKGTFGKLVRGLGLGRTLSLGFTLARGLRAKPNDLLDLTFNTVLPIAFGPYAARVAFVPLHAASPRRGAGADRDYLAARLAERARTEALRWEVRAQFFTGETTPIEDPSVAWPSPWQRLGELVTIPGAASPALAAHVEALSFNPWHALVEHRPLGALMRARKHAYFASTKGRGAAPEPDGREWEGLA